EDVVQDACVRAMRFLSSLRDDDARAWLFAIVRNTWYSRVSRRANMAEATPLDGAQDERPRCRARSRGTAAAAAHGRPRALSARAAACRLPRSDRTARVRRLVLQGNRCGGSRADRHRHVATRACTR